MSILSEIDRISNNIGDTYSVLESLGANIPNTRNSENLPPTAANVQAVLFKEQDLTDEQKSQARLNIGIPNLVDPADYIVEQGVDGIWTYRKWASGIAECWTRQTFSLKITTEAGRVYRSDAQTAPDYPEGLFIETPHATSMTHGSAGYYAWLADANPGDKTKPSDFYLFRANTLSSNYQFGVCFEAKGRWK